MPSVRFQIYTFAGSLLWCFVFAYLGYVLGRQWNSNPEVKAILSNFDWAVAGFVAVLAAFYIYGRFRPAKK